MLYLLFFILFLSSYFRVLFLFSRFCYFLFRWAQGPITNCLAKFGPISTYFCKPSQDLALQPNRIEAQQAFCFPLARSSHEPRHVGRPPHVVFFPAQSMQPCSPYRPTSCPHALPEQRLPYEGMLTGPPLHACRVEPGTSTRFSSRATAVLIARPHAGPA